jgi:hypothetical protein
MNKKLTTSTTRRGGRALKLIALQHEDFSITHFCWRVSGFSLGVFADINL